MATIFESGPAPPPISSSKRSRRTLWLSLRGPLGIGDAEMDQVADVRVVARPDVDPVALRPHDDRAAAQLARRVADDVDRAALPGLALEQRRRELQDTVARTGGDEERQGEGDARAAHVSG